VRCLWMITIPLLIACGGKKDADGPTCEQVTDHILEVSKQQMMGHEGINVGGGQRKAMIEQCEKRVMTLEVRTCLMGAKTIAEIATCRGRGKSNVLERPRRPRPGSDSAGSAGSAVTPGSGNAGSGSGTAPGSGSGSAH
jgi:hypothetical protein